MLGPSINRFFDKYLNSNGKNDYRIQIPDCRMYRQQDKNIFNLLKEEKS